MMRELWAINRSRNKITKLTTESWLHGEEDRACVCVCVCVYVYVHVSLMVAIWGHFQQSSASLISRFSTWTQNPSRPQPSKLVSGTQRAQCTCSV